MDKLNSSHHVQDLPLMEQHLQTLTHIRRNSKEILNKWNYSLNRYKNVGMSFFKFNFLYKLLVGISILSIVEVVFVSLCSYDRNQIPEFLFAWRCIEALNLPCVNFYIQLKNKDIENWLNGKIVAGLRFYLHKKVGKVQTYTQAVWW